MKRFLFYLCLTAIMLILMACDKTKINGIKDNEIEISKETSMKLFINEKEIPVIWEDNASVSEIIEEASKGEIIVSMSMYSDNEQFGYLGKAYSGNNTNIKTSCGDIVLYNNDHIVLFYGSNTWSYTRLGKLDLDDDSIVSLLSNGDVRLRISTN